MTVAELIKQLQELESNVDVYVIAPCEGLDLVTDVQEIRVVECHTKFDKQDGDYDEVTRGESRYHEGKLGYRIV
jgi:hypothetical protein